MNISTPDETGAVTISAYHGDGATSERAEQLIQRIFKDYKVILPMSAKTHNNWTGLASEFVQSDAAGTRMWLVIGACRDKVLLLITVNDTEQAMKPRKAIYQSILDSLVITDPEAKHQ